MRRVLVVAVMFGVAGIAAGQEPAGPGAATAKMVVAAKVLNERQRALAEQVGKLADMATVLQTEVDKTNKDVLSLKVVRTAAEIEAMAKAMKGDGKR